MGSQFTQYPAYSKLQQLAASPLDLTKPGALTPERIASMVAQAAGFKCLYATERVTPEVLICLSQLADQAKVHDKMAQMQAGEILNRIEGFPSDNRSVLHTAMRDLFDSPNSAPAAREAAKKAQAEHTKLKAFLEKIGDRFTDIVTVAIGGSDLGPRALYLSLEAYQKPDRRAHFISNVDPDDVAQVFKNLDLSRTLVVVVSKSGTTLETVTNEEQARARFVAAGLPPEQYFVSVSGQGSPMDNPKRYLACFYMWDYVGGRFSATSMCGALTLAFGYGYEALMELLRGAHEMDKTALTRDLKTNLPLLGALLSVWNHNFLNLPTLAFIPYSEALFRFPAHIQQVEMESNGKRIDREGRPVNFQTGPIIWGEPGTNAQHSFYQLIHQGTATIPLEFVGFKESQHGEDLEVLGTTSQEKLLANLFAQAIALATGKSDKNPNKFFPGNRPSHILLAQKLTPYTLGALFAYIEHKVVFEGFIWDINSFDQEGVQLGKVLADKINHLFKARRTGSQEEAFPLGEAYLNQLEEDLVPSKP